MVNWTSQDLLNYERKHSARIKLPHAKPECAFQNEPVATTKGKAKSSTRITVRIKSCRCRLLDPDNLCPKYIIDALRYAGAIHNDREEDIILEISQERVATKAEQKTIVEIG